MPRCVRAHAWAVLARAEAAELALSEFGGLKRGTLSVQASQTIASYWLPRHLVVFRRAHPQIQVRLAIGNTAQVAAAVESEMAELGFVEGAVESEHFASTPVARDQLVVVVGLEHPWGGRDRLTRGDLVEGEWTLREPGSGTRSVFEDALSQLGIEPNTLRISCHPTRRCARP
jgi:DNA-binding transcriptional LysR family regulator